MSCSRISVPLLLGSLLSFSAVAEDSAGSVFEQRIMPIFRSEKPSSCIQCHLASVDLKDYIRPSHQETFLSLRDQGLIDIENPSESKILRLIRMGDADQDVLAKRIHSKTRDAELAAFSDWILRCCEDEQLVSLPRLDETALATPAKSNAVIRYARKDRVLDSFVRHIWSQRMRCFPCHTPGEIDRDNAKLTKAVERYDDFKRQYGAKMDLFKATPEETLRAWITGHPSTTGHHRADGNKRLPLINFEEPANSLLVLKPTSKVPAKLDDGTRAKPSSAIPVSHVGGLKMHQDDVSYKAFVTWIDDVARVRSDGFATPADLPDEALYPTKHVIRLKDLPESWENLAAVQIQVFLLGTDVSSESTDRPIAVTQSLVTPRRFVNGNLFAVRSLGEGAVLKGVNREQDSATDPVVQWNPAGVTLPDGAYRMKVFLDQEDRVRSDATVWLDQGDRVAEIEFTATWGEGFKNAQVVSLKASSD